MTHPQSPRTPPLTPEDEARKLIYFIPPCDETVERLMESPDGLRRLCLALEEKGVQSTPKLSELPPQDAKDAIRGLYQYLGARERTQ